MNSLQSTLNSQDSDYTKNLQLFFELYRIELEHHAVSLSISLSLSHIISDDVEVANILSNHFSNVVKNLKISEKFVTDSLPQSLSRHPTLNAILKYKTTQACM